MSRAFVFPGQGSQFIGMGRDLFESYAQARQTFEEVDEALGEKLSDLIFNGPEEKLNLTENTQPALMTVSMAVVNVLTRHYGMRLEKICSMVAGHSLGEYSALTAAGALELADTARLLRIRGQAMQKAVPVGIGSMAAILGLDLPDVQAMLKESATSEVCQSANDNSPGQVVVSGHRGAVEAFVALATQKGAKKAVTLPVSAPFHCSLMAPAAQVMSHALSNVDIRPPCVPVVCNVTAEGVEDPHEIRRLLVDQITGLVRWRESVLWMKTKGVNEIVELGAGKVLSGLVKRIDKEIAAESAGTKEQVEALAAKLK